ncbi:hypothetical protein HGP16_29070 [Rhizobium sp. P40RR-XXII]|uniref:hypothetical protein n=1 Tax=unclassified Rhizobium TaxID=2613769 RepID=UPI001456874F|nr:MULTISPECIES: hypothetical protein [unclassified Rhizobium]NLR88949.1 hypothetical protein [Rhizobium sp. P28RR-XV]NLS20573.1 hypothetical protein [Rhizobium sp. P40RR-XXII]
MASNVYTQQAHRGVIKAHEGKDPSMPGWPARLSQIALGYFTRHWDRLDIEETPNSVKRDLGFLDGRAPYREEDRMH